MIQSPIKYIFHQNILFGQPNKDYKKSTNLTSFFFSSTSLSSLLMLLKFFHDLILTSSISTCICSLTASPPLLNIATTSLASLLLLFVVFTDIVTSQHLHFNHHPSSSLLNIVVSTITHHRHFNYPPSSLRQHRP